MSAQRPSGNDRASTLRALASQFSLFVDYLLWELPHKATAHTLINHRAWAVWMPDMFIDPVAMPMPVAVMMMVMPVPVGMIMVVVMIMPVQILVIIGVVVFRVVVVHVHLAFRQTLFEAFHQIMIIGEYTSFRLAGALYKSVQYMILIRQIMRL